MAQKLILVADDYDHAAAILAELLKMNAGHDTMSAKDGVEALSMALARKPDVAVLDVDMPLLDGIETARALRNKYGEHRPLLIAATGRSMDGANLSGMFDHVLGKPVDVVKLCALIDEV